MAKRVFVVEDGAVGPGGNSLDKLWENAIKGISGIQTINNEILNPFNKINFEKGFLELLEHMEKQFKDTNDGKQLTQEVKDEIIKLSKKVSLEPFSLEDFKTKITGQADIDLEIEIPNIKTKEIKKRMARFSQLACVAASQLDYEKILQVSQDNPYRVGVILGSGTGGLDEWQTQSERLITQGRKKVSPFFIAKQIIDIVCFWISVIFQAHGPNFAVVSACASGAHAIATAYDKIAAGRADLMLTGGTEGGNTPLGIAGFNAARALSTKNEEPEKASRPFDINRDGFVLAEGAAILALANEETVKKYGFFPLAEIVGIGETGDAHNLTAPDPTGKCTAEAMKIAMKMAGIWPKDIGYINAHGTATKTGDEAEIKAIKIAFGDEAYRTSVSSTKSGTGHLLGAAGPLESAFCIKSLKTGIIPPTINLENLDPKCAGVLHVPNKAIEQKINYAMTNSFGFGGHNATLIYRII